MITFLSRAETAQPLLLATLLSVLLNACGGGGGGSASSPTPPVPPATTYTAKSGVAQKGPLIKGATVTAQELDSNLSPNGKQYSYQTTSDLGTFSPTSTFTSQYIGVNATGYYFDEVLNALSTGPVTLNGYSDLAIDTVLNVNVLTTLAYQRIQNLVVNSHLTFTAARAQAESEVLTALNIPPASYGSFSSLDLGGSTDGDHILAAISSIFVHGNAAGPLSVLIGNFQSDLGANGVITTATTKSALAAASKAVDATAVAANLTQEYSSLGVTFTPADITQWIDQDGDGVVGKFKFQVADATPSSPFTFPSFVVSQIAGSSVSVTAGQLSINGTPVTGAVTVQATDVVAISPGAGDFPSGVLTAYLLSGTTKTARVSFVSGLLSIAVTPNAPNVALGLTQQFKATGTFSDTSTADLTSSVTWTWGSPANATINSSSGLAQTLAVGPTIITATSGSVSGSSTTNVTAAILESFVIVPDPAYSGVGLTIQLTATATYSDATTANVTSMATWTSSTPSVARVGPTTGLATGASLGSTTISATIGSLTETAPLSITANVWHPGGSLTVPRYNHTATLLPTGVVMVAGGNGTGRHALSIASAELYDPVVNTWSPAASMSISRYAHTATLLSNGKILVAGGSNWDDEVYPITILTSAELYDPVTNSWSAAGSMSTPRSGHTATLLSNGQVLVAGGGNQIGNTASAELYDPVANTWSTAGSMATARDGHTATLLPNGKVLVTGGLDGIGVTESAELYDPIARTWSPAASMATARYGQTATLLTNGKVLVPGGVGSSGGDLAAAELYDPVANTWSPAGTMATARSDHIATPLPSGKILVAGGNTSSAELYDPVANRWSPAGSMSTTRSIFTGTLLSNGVVLAAGGFGAIGTLSSSELYW